MHLVWRGRIVLLKVRGSRTSELLCCLGVTRGVGGERPGLMPLAPV